VLGIIFVNLSLSSDPAFSLLLYLDMRVRSDENPTSHNYIVAHGMRKCSALSASPGYSPL
jgi:hypothetical protein